MFFFQCYPSGLPKRKEAVTNIFEDPLSEVTCIFSKNACFCLPYRSPFAFSKKQTPGIPCNAMDTGGLYGAAEGSRTPLCSLGSCRSTDELQPHLEVMIAHFCRNCNTKNGASLPLGQRSVKHGSSCSFPFKPLPLLVFSPILIIRLSASETPPMERYFAANSGR